MLLVVDPVTGEVYYIDKARNACEIFYLEVRVVCFLVLWMQSRRESWSPSIASLGGVIAASMLELS